MRAGQGRLYIIDSSGMQKWCSRVQQVRCRAIKFTRASRQENFYPHHMPLMEKVGFGPKKSFFLDIFRALFKEPQDKKTFIHIICLWWNGDTSYKHECLKWSAIQQLALGTWKLVFWFSYLGFGKYVVVIICYMVVATLIVTVTYLAKSWEQIWQFLDWFH